MDPLNTGIAMQLFGNWILSNPYTVPAALVTAAVFCAALTLVPQIGARTYSCIGAALVLALIAFAQPQLVERVQKQEFVQHHFVLALDDSGSMTRTWASAQEKPVFTPDGWKNTFFSTFKDAATRLASGRQIDTVGVVAFSSKARIIAPSNSAGPAAAEALDALVPEEMGTNSHRGMQTAIDELKKTPPENRVLVVFTDGDDEGEEVDEMTADEGNAMLKELHDLNASLYIFRPTLLDSRRLDAAAVMELAGASRAKVQSPQDVLNNIKLVNQFEPASKIVWTNHVLVDLRSIFLAAAILVGCLTFFFSVRRPRV